MKNFRINIVEDIGKVSHCWIDRKFLFLWWSSLRYYTPEDMRQEVPLGTLYTFESIKEAETFLKNQYKSWYSVIHRRIIK